MDAWLTRTYERLGRRYVAVCLFCLYAVLAIVVAPLLMVFPFIYEGLTVGQAAPAILVIEVGLPLAFLAGALTTRGGLRALSAWSAGERDEVTAARARRAVYKAPLRFLLGGGTLAIPGLPAFVLAVTSAAHHRTALDWLELAIGTAGAGSFVGVTGYFLMDVALRPVRATLADDRPVQRATGLVTRILLVLLWLMFIVGTASGFLAARRENVRAGHLLSVYGVALGVTALSALVLGPLLAATLLGPIRQLARGTRAVTAGDLDVAVPITTNDELGDLARSFNEMVAGLRDREALREHNAELVAELQASRARIVAAADAERRAVERDLHDGAQQSLVLLGLKLGMAARLIDNDPAAAARMHEELRIDLDRAVSQLRDLAHGIYPALLAQEGLPGALREAAEHAAISAELHVEGTRRYPAEIEAAVYFCCLEALQNAAKHGGVGTRASVRLEQREGILAFEVADSGAGLRRPNAGTGAGIQNMTDRIGALGGTLRIYSAPGRGTRVAGTIPLGD